MSGLWLVTWRSQSLPFNWCIALFCTIRDPASVILQSFWQQSGIPVMHKQCYWKGPRKSTNDVNWVFVGGPNVHIEFLHDETCSLEDLISWTVFIEISLVCPIDKSAINQLVGCWHIGFFSSVALIWNARNPQTSSYDFSQGISRWLWRETDVKTAFDSVQDNLQTKSGSPPKHLFW